MFKSRVYFVSLVQKEKSCDNIPKEPVVFEKMKLVSLIEFFSKIFFSCIT